MSSGKGRAQPASMPHPSCSCTHCLCLCRFQQGLTCEYVPLPVGSKELVDDMWPLYKK